MINRRQMIAAGAATVAVSAAAPVLAVPGTAKGLDDLFDVLVSEQIDLQPEGVTSLGLDVGPRLKQKSELTDRSPAGTLRQQHLGESQLARLEAFDPRALAPADALNREIVLYGLREQVENFHRFKYAGGGAGAPYVLNQFQGSAFHDLPDFLDSQHRIETRDDAEAYLARLAAFGAAVDQDGEQARLDQSLGVTPPDFVCDGALQQLQALRATPAAKAVLVQSLVRRTREKAIAGDWEARATKIYGDGVLPSLDRQIDLVRSLRAQASHDAGVWRLPDGEAYYRASVKSWTTTELTGDEIHRQGLDLVKELSARADEAMRAQGLTTGTVGARYRGLYEDPKYRYPNTDEGKAKLLADLNLKVQAVQVRLPQYFGVLPKAKVEIRRIPVYTESGAPGGYYNGASLDGSRLC
jgi:uncharacterized protein (DUF885 family)